MLDPEVVIRIRRHADSAQVLYDTYHNENTGLLVSDLRAVLSDWEARGAEVERLKTLAIHAEGAFTGLQHERNGLRVALAAERERSVRLRAALKYAFEEKP